jgi:hypothetical protein
MNLIFEAAAGDALATDAPTAWEEERRNSMAIWPSMRSRTPSSASTLYDSVSRGQLELSCSKFL